MGKGKKGETREEYQERMAARKAKKKSVLLPKDTEENPDDSYKLYKREAITQRLFTPVEEMPDRDFRKKYKKVMIEFTAQVAERESAVSEEKEKLYAEQAAAQRELLELLESRKRNQELVDGLEEAGFKRSRVDPLNEDKKEEETEEMGISLSNNLMEVASAQLLPKEGPKNVRTIASEETEYRPIKEEIEESFPTMEFEVYTKFPRYEFAYTPMIPTHKRETVLPPINEERSLSASSLSENSEGAVSDHVPFATTETSRSPSPVITQPIAEEVAALPVVGIADSSSEESQNFFPERIAISIGATLVNQQEVESQVSGLPVVETHLVLEGEGEVHQDTKQKYELVIAELQMKGEVAAPKILLPKLSEVSSTDLNQLDKLNLQDGWEDLGDDKSSVSSICSDLSEMVATTSSKEVKQELEPSTKLTGSESKQAGGWSILRTVTFGFMR